MLQLSSSMKVLGSNPSLGSLFVEFVFSPLASVGSHLSQSKTLILISYSKSHIGLNVGVCVCYDGLVICPRLSSMSVRDRHQGLCDPDRKSWSRRRMDEWDAFLCSLLLKSFLCLGAKEWSPHCFFAVKQTLNSAGFSNAAGASNLYHWLG